MENIDHFVTPTYQLLVRQWQAIPPHSTQLAQLGRFTPLRLTNRLITLTDSVRVEKVPYITHMRYALPLLVTVTYIMCECILWHLFRRYIDCESKYVVFHFSNTLCIVNVVKYHSCVVRVPVNSSLPLLYMVYMAMCCYIEILHQTMASLHATVSQCHMHSEAVGYACIWPYTEW